MPRETVTHQGGTFEVQVGWSPDQDVQIGVSSQGGTPLVREFMAPDPLGLAIRQLLESFGMNTHGTRVTGMFDMNNQALGEAFLAMLEERCHYSSLWSDLNRYEINRLIKLLRKARDSAYGRDE